MAHAFPHNASARKTFIRELKNVNGLGALINEMFRHKECYHELADIMATPESNIPRRLAFAMNECHNSWLNELMGMPNNPFAEAVAPPMEDRFPKDDEDEDDQDLSGAPPVPPDQEMPPDAVGDMGAMGGGDMGMGGMGGGMPMGGGGGGGMSMPMGGGMPPDGTDPNADPNAPQDPNNPNAPVDPNNPNAGGDPNAMPPDPNNPAGAEDPNAMQDPNMGQGDPNVDPNGIPMKATDKLNQQAPPTKKEFAYHHLTREMSKYEPMKGFMKEMLGG